MALESSIYRLVLSIVPEAKDHLGSISFTMSIAVIVLLLIATYCDLRDREIPDWISMVIMAFGLIASVTGFAGLPLSQSLLGITLAFFITSPMFYLGGIGGGDVKLVSALGSVLGPAGLLSGMFWMAIGGGVLAVIAKTRGKSDFAYVPAILFGVCIVFFRQNLAS